MSKKCIFLQIAKICVTRPTSGQNTIAHICARVCCAICTLGANPVSRTKPLFFHAKLQFRPKTLFFLFSFFQKNLQSGPVYKSSVNFDILKNILYTSKFSPRYISARQHSTPDSKKSWSASPQNTFLREKFQKCTGVYSRFFKKCVF